LLTVGIPQLNRLRVIAVRLTKMLRVARIKRIFQRYEEQFAVGAMHKVIDAMRMVGYILILAYITQCVETRPQPGST
jgi:hypothetical protein